MKICSWVLNCMNTDSEAGKRVAFASGFTLIEVMVALAIIAIALSAVSRSLGLTVSNQTHLESRVLATWVAENSIVEQQLFPGKQAEKKQVQSMLNRQWVIETTSEPTFIPEIYRMSVEVREEGSEQLSANLFSVVGADD